MVELSLIQNDTSDTPRSKQPKFGDDKSSFLSDKILPPGKLARAPSFIGNIREFLTVPNILVTKVPASLCAMCPSMAATIYIQPLARVGI